MADSGYCQSYVRRLLANNTSPPQSQIYKLRINNVYNGFDAINLLVYAEMECVRMILAIFLNTRRY